MEMETRIHTQSHLEAKEQSNKPPLSPLTEEINNIHDSDKKQYDFVAERKTVKPTSIFESTGNLIKGCLGAGLLGVHEAYMKNGLWSSLILTIAFGIYVTYCIHILVKSAHILCQRLHIPEMSFPDVAEASLQNGPFPNLRKYGKWFRYAVDFMICIDLFGACCVYEIIIAKSIKQVVEDSYELSPGNMNILRLYIFALLIPILLLCMITKLKYLAPFSFVANIFIMSCVIATVAYGIQVAPPISEMPAWKDALGFFEFCGVVIFSMECIGVSLPIENSMRNPKQFPVVLCSGMFVSVVFIIIVGFFGYWGFGENCISPVTLNFPKETFPTVLKCLIAIMIFITFAINFWAPFNLLWCYVSKKHNPEKFWIWERVYRATCVLVISAVAIAFPNITNLMGLIGAFGLSNIGFIFPAIIDVLIIWEDPGLGMFKWRLWKNIIILTLGILLLLAGTYANLKGLIASL